MVLLETLNEENPMIYDERYIETHRDEIINTLVSRFMDSLTIEDALEYIVNDMTDCYNSMTNHELMRELED